MPGVTRRSIPTSATPPDAQLAFDLLGVSKLA